MNEMTDETKLMMTKATMRILDSWKINADGMRAVLDLGAKEGTTRNFQKYRMHSSFPENEKTYRCADYVIRIEGALRTTYPVNNHMAERWLRKVNRRMGMTPIEKICTEGENGLIMALAELDCTFCYDLTDNAQRAS